MTNGLAKFFIDYEIRKFNQRIAKHIDLIQSIQEKNLNFTLVQPPELSKGLVKLNFDGLFDSGNGYENNFKINTVKPPRFTHSHAQ